MKPAPKKTSAAEDNVVRALCVDSFVPFTLSVKKIDAVCRDVRLFEEQILETQRTIDLRIAKREAAEKREAAARAAAAASRAVADQLLQAAHNNS